jgi:hypothetical protein
MLGGVDNPHLRLLLWWKLKTEFHAAARKRGEIQIPKKGWFHFQSPHLRAL